MVQVFLFESLQSPSYPQSRAFFLLRCPPLYAQMPSPKQRTGLMKNATYCLITVGCSEVPSIYITMGFIGIMDL